MEYTSTALLLLEWTHEDRCALCHANRPNHEIGCALDNALAERGLTTQTNRDAARKLLVLP